MAAALAPPAVKARQRPSLRAMDRKVDRISRSRVRVGQRRRVQWRLHLPKVKLVQRRRLRRAKHLRVKLPKVKLRRAKHLKVKHLKARRFKAKCHRGKRHRARRLKGRVLTVSRPVASHHQTHLHKVKFSKETPLKVVKHSPRELPSRSRQEDPKMAVRAPPLLAPDRKARMRLLQVKRPPQPRLKA